MRITIKSFNGIGDALFLTPTLRVIKEVCPKVHITVNTNHAWIFRDNPFVDYVGINHKEGVFLGYPDPIHRGNPTQHHILSDWEIVCGKYGIETAPPDLQPELFNMGWRSEDADKVGVQIIHKGHWHAKKVWPYFEALLQYPSFEAIPRMPSAESFARKVAEYKCVVCSEGGVSHLAKAYGVPAAVVFGGFASPEWSGYEDHVNITNVKECSYCYNPSPCEAEVERECMREITVERVLEAVDEAVG